MYLGGNGINCEVELDDGPHGLTMRCRTQRPSEAGEGSTGPSAESRFARTVEPEASLLGVVFDDRGIMTAAPYEVIADGHWVFAGTGLRPGDRFGTESQHERCPGGASGHETDKMSGSSPPGTTLLARGLNPDGGGAEMVCYERPGGGAAFAAGSINWPSSLLVDRHVSRITRNVLARYLA
jgi:hypothetical protein